MALRRRYVLQARQTNESMPKVSQSLGVETMQKLCDALNDADLFYCSEVWRTGAVVTVMLIHVCVLTMNSCYIGQYDMHVAILLYSKCK